MDGDLDFDMEDFGDDFLFVLKVFIFICFDDVVKVSKWVRMFEFVMNVVVFLEGVFFGLLDDVNVFMEVRLVVIE